MKEVQISDGIVPLGEFKAQAARLLKRIGESGQPMVITQNGRPAGVLLSPREYDRMQGAAALAGIDRRRAGGCRERPDDHDHGTARAPSCLAQRPR